MALTTFFTYLLTASLLMGLGYLYYALCLKAETCFRFNRVFLLLSLLGATLFPLIKVQPPAMLASVPSLYYLTEVVIRPDMPSPQAVSWEQIILGLYLLGVAVSLAFFLLQGVQLIRMIRTSRQRELRQGYTLIYTQGSFPTASFFRYLFWNNEVELSPWERDQILAHELCHIRQWHSLDMLLVELLQVVFWFNPLVYLYRRDLVQTHEYLADQAAVQQPDVSVRAYKQLMLSRVLNTRLAMAHSFFHAPIKDRIRMLGTRSNQRKVIVLAILTLPVLAGTFLMSGFIKKIDVQVSTEGPAAAMPHQPARISTGPAQVPPSPAEASPSPEALVAAERQPQPLNMREVQRRIGYPQAARDAGVGGTVVMRVLVDEKGNYLRHKLINQAHPLLVEAVEQHLSLLEFEPAVQSGKPIKFWVNIPFNFKLLN